MVVVMGEDSDEVIYFQLRHGLHDELAVMAEEEKASTGTSSFSRILNLLDIFWRLQRFDDILIFDAVKESNFPKGLGGILTNYYVSIQVERVAVV